jgi:hypothetical protein
VRYVEQAGDRALAQGASAAAEGYYRELVAHLDGLGRSRDAASAREKLGTVLEIVARYEAALAVLEQAAGTYLPAEQPESLARVTTQIGRGYSINGRTRGAAGPACAGTPGDEWPLARAGRAVLRSG